MGIIAKQAKERELVPAGSHAARCFRMIHLGHIPDDGQFNKGYPVNKVILYFEIPNEMRVFSEERGEEPMSISKEYTVSLGEKSNLRGDLESWRGKTFTTDQLAGFDITDVISVPCLINVIHKTSKSTGNPYHYIAGISPMPKGMTCPDQINPSFIFDFDQNFNNLELLHEYFQDKIKSSVEYHDKMNPVSVQDAPMPTIDDIPDDLPF